MVNGHKLVQDYYSKEILQTSLKIINRLFKGKIYSCLPSISWLLLLLFVKIYCSKKKMNQKISFSFNKTDKVVLITLMTHDLYSCFILNHFITNFKSHIPWQPYKKKVLISSL